jgi:sugar lactone lactonase YvrE
MMVVLVLSFLCSGAGASDGECQSSGEYSFVCGPKNAEDLVLVPGTSWIISSGMDAGAVIYLIDAREKSWAVLYPTGASSAQQDMEIYGACPGAPDPDNFITHGLNLRPGAMGHSTLYVVGHGAREAVEVFDVNANSDSPVLTWTGCVEMPEGMAANSVASFSDGSLVVTIPLHPGKTIGDAMAGELTGAIYKWSPGDRGFNLVRGTELPYANGIEVSTDEREIYVASTGLYTVTAYSNSNPARQLRSTAPMAFIPDNLHMADNGNLITAGLIADDPVCGNVRGPTEFDLEEFAACPRPFIVKAIDPKSMQTKDVVRGPANKLFSNVTMALSVDDELWIGTFAGNRVAYRSLKRDD